MAVENKEKESKKSVDDTKAKDESKKETKPEVKSEASSSGTSKSVDTSDSNLMAALSYLWVLSVIMFIVKKDDEFVMFHAKQGLVIFLISFLTFFPFLGLLVFFGCLVLIVIGFSKAYQGEKYKIPVIGDLAEKLNF